MKSLTTSNRWPHPLLRRRRQRRHSRKVQLLWRREGISREIQVYVYQSFPTYNIHAPWWLIPNHVHYSLIDQFTVMKRRLSFKPLLQGQIGWGYPKWKIDYLHEFEFCGPHACEFTVSYWKALIHDVLHFFLHFSYPSWEIHMRKVIWIPFQSIVSSL